MKNNNKEVKELIEDLVKNANGFLGHSDDNNDITTEELVNRANRFLDEDGDTFLDEFEDKGVAEDGAKQEDDKDITKEDIASMAVAIHRNFNHDATQPYTPAENFTFHDVTYNDNKGTHTFVCSEYAIKEQMITFYGVRIKTSYYQEEIAPATTIRFRGGRSDIGYLSHDMYDSSVSDFSVYGYRETDCKTINREKLMDIDSFTVSPTSTNDWYNLTKEMALEQSLMKIESHNEKIVSENKVVLSNEGIDESYSHLVQSRQSSVWSDAIDKYDDTNWFLKLFKFRPIKENLTDSITTISEYQRGIAIMKYTNLLEADPSFKDYDWSYYLEVFGDEKTKSPEDINGAVINAEFEEVE